jgi:SAM-dependent methyltransferase
MQQSTKDALAKIIPPEGHLWNALQFFYRAPRRTDELRRRITRNGIFFREYELESASLTTVKTIDRVIELFHPRTALDIGCGVGRSLDYFLERGVSAEGVEGSRIAIQRARHPKLIAEFNLNNVLDLGRKFDILWSFEFVEHIHPAFVPNLTRTLSNHSDRIIMSAARPGQGGMGHFNEQPPEYWIKAMARHGYSYDEASTASLQATGEPYSENIIVLCR